MEVNEAHFTIKHQLMHRVVDMQFDDFFIFFFLPCIVKQNNAWLHYKYKHY